MQPLILSFAQPRPLVPSPRGKNKNLLSHQPTEWPDEVELRVIRLERNEGPVKTLRNEWVNFQQVKFLQAQVEKNPADEAEKQRLADAEKKMPGMDQRAKAAEAAAQAIEDDIFKEQPTPAALLRDPACRTLGVTRPSADHPSFRLARMATSF